MPRLRRRPATCRSLPTHHYELASAAVQIAIVLASAAIITGIGALVWIAVGRGALGVLLCLFTAFAPTVLHV